MQGALNVVVEQKRAEVTVCFVVLFFISHVTVESHNFETNLSPHTHKLLNRSKFLPQVTRYQRALVQQKSIIKASQDRVEKLEDDLAK